MRKTQQGASGSVHQIMCSIAEKTTSNMSIGGELNNHGDKLIVFTVH